MDVLDRITSGHWAPSWQTLEEAHGIPPGDLRQRYLPGELVVYEPRGDDRQVAKIVEDDGSPNLRASPFSSERKTFLPPVWMPRARVLGVAR